MTTLRATRVLLVDDDPSIRRVLGFWLQNSGHAVMTAATAEEALHMLDRFTPDVVVTDLRLPGLNGLELKSRLELMPQFQHLTVFVMSAYPGPEGVESSIFFPKPDGLPKLMAAVAEAAPHRHSAH